MRRKDIRRRIEAYFFVHPTARLRVREIERALKVPLPSAIRYCRELEKEGILATHRVGNVSFYSAGRGGKYLMEKRLFNIRQLYESGLVEHLKRGLSNPAIVLFGSYAKGEDTEDSDIDLYVETPSRKEAGLGTFERALKRKIQVFRHRSIREIKNPHLANNIVNGIVLNKQVEVFHEGA